MLGELVIRLLAWGYRRVGARTSLSLTLLLVMLSSVAVGLMDMVRGIKIGLMLLVIALGVLVGWALAKSPLPGWLAGLVAGAVGLELLMFRVGRLTRPLMVLLQALFNLAWELLYWPLEGLPNGMSILLALMEFGSGIGALLTRLRDWVLALAAGNSIFDPVATVMVWGWAMWVMSVWAAWAVRRRRHPLQAMIPAGALLGGSLAYSWSDKAYTLLYPLGATLVLMALAGHDARERHWEERGTDFPEDVGLDVAIATTYSTLVVVWMAILIPSLSVRPIVEFVQRLAQEQREEARQIGDSLGLDRARLPESGGMALLDQRRVGGLPRSHLLGSGPELSQQVVMVISTGATPFDAQEFTGQPSPRYYWRSLTYGMYTGRGWATIGTQTVKYSAGEQAISPTLPAHLKVSQKVRFVGEPDGLLYAAGNLVTVDHDYRVAWRNLGDAFGATIEAEEYQAESLVPVVSETQLRAADKIYPAWVQSRYLSLPYNIPERVQSLALDLTATKPTPYDRARAIETYLRTYTYTLDVPEPPVHRDVADYFLFDLRRGYCDYYATSMVVLARAAGLPARLVIGYATGTYDGANARYVVTEADAHAWVEIYFPGYGWVEFEPTAGRPAIERPTEPILPEMLELGTDSRITRRVGRFWNCLLALPAGIALLGLIAVSWLVTDGWRMRRLPAVDAVATIYHRLYSHGRRLNVPMWPGDTPYQFIDALVKKVTELARESRWEALLAPATQEARWLTDLYVRSCYSPRSPDAAEQARAIRTWQRLSKRLWLAWVGQMGK